MELNPSGTSTNPTEGTVIPGSIQIPGIVPEPTGVIEPNPSVIPAVPTEPTDAGSRIKGLTEEEYNDPNKIQITIQDKATPIVILFGPAACGKTMTLVRLTRYLKQEGFKVEPIPTFRPTADRHYAAMCGSFNNDVNSRKAADSTNRISFMLLKIMDERGKTICQILEAPGEYYYHPKHPRDPFPSYVNVILSSPNRKVWCYMVEPSWSDQPVRDGYVDKIRSLKSSMRTNDKAVFVFNKIDLTGFVLAPGKINEKEAKKEIMDLYPGIFKPFQTKGVFGLSDNFKFVSFQTGYYTKDPDGGQFFDAGDDAYPRKLWEIIRKLVRG